MRKCQPLPELDEAECLTPTGMSSSPFSEFVEEPNGNEISGSAPSLVNHPHLDKSMRSMSTSVAARRKEYAEKRAQTESKSPQKPNSLSRTERIAFMKRTRSVSSTIHDGFAIESMHEV